MPHDFVEVPKKEAHTSLSYLRLHLVQLLLCLVDIEGNRGLVKRKESLVFLYFVRDRRERNLNFTELLAVSFSQKRDVYIKVALRDNVFEVFFCRPCTQVCGRSESHSDVMEPLNLGLLKQLFVVGGLDYVFEAIVSPNTKAVVSNRDVPVYKANVYFKFILFFS